jgi:hypothetical protein
MQTRFIVALALIATASLPAQAGAKIDDPVKFVTGVYNGWSTHKAEPEGIFTARLDALRALDEKEAHGEVGRGNDFSFWCNCQDGEVKSAVVSGRDVENAKGRKVVDAKFELDGKSQEIFFYFEATKDGWKIDDARLAGKGGWTLSLIYKYGWDGGK